MATNVMAFEQEADVMKLERGTLVKATRHLDPKGANVTEDELGVTFEETDAYGDGNGPMVRWFSGGCCNVYPGDVVKVVFR